MHSHAMSVLEIYVAYEWVSETWNWCSHYCIDCNFNGKPVFWKVYNLITRCTVEKEPTSPKKESSSCTDCLVTRFVVEIYVFVINVNKLANVWLIEALKFRELRSKDVYSLSQGHLLRESEGMLLRLFFCSVCIESVHVIWRVVWLKLVIDYDLFFSVMFLLEFHEL